jgi:DNA-binding transcriptional LysR family regulator
MVLIAAPGHPLARGGEPVAPEVLAGETFVVREQGSGSRAVVDEALAGRGISPSRTLEVGGTEAIKQVVAAGLGLAIVSAATIRDQVALGKLEIIAMRDLEITRTLWQLRIPGRPWVPAAAAFDALLRDAKTKPASLVATPA